MLHYVGSNSTCQTRQSVSIFLVYFPSCSHWPVAWPRALFWNLSRSVATCYPWWHHMLPWCWVSSLHRWHPALSYLWLSQLTRGSVWDLYLSGGRNCQHSAMDASKQPHAEQRENRDFGNSFETQYLCLNTNHRHWAGWNPSICHGVRPCHHLWHNPLSSPPYLISG